MNENLELSVRFNSMGGDCDLVRSSLHETKGRKGVRENSYIDRSYKDI